MLTPARTWAVADPSAGDPHTDGPVPRMPLAQRIAMFITVAGPILGLVAALVWLWHSRTARWHIGWPELVALLGMYAFAGFGVTIGYHRLLTHKAFQTIRPMRLLFAVLGPAPARAWSSAGWPSTAATTSRPTARATRTRRTCTGEGFWEAFRGFWHSHLGWTFQADKPQIARSVPDLLGDPAMLWIDQLYFLWVAIGMLIPAVVVGWYEHSWRGFVAGLIWGGLVRICLMQHVTWSVNSVCHVWGNRPFNSSDHSTNNLPVAVLSLGEGWHNNHHAFPTSARHGLRWWQFDPSWLIITTLKRVGLAWDVRLPSDAALAAKARTRPSDGETAQREDKAPGVHPGLLRCVGPPAHASLSVLAMSITNRNRTSPFLTRL